MNNRVSVGVLKRLSKELYSILNARDPRTLELDDCRDIVTALHILVPHTKKVVQTLANTQPLVVKQSHSDCVMPVFKTYKKSFRPSATWGLTEQGLREQLTVYGSLGAGANETLLSWAYELMGTPMGLVFVEAGGSHSTWVKIFALLEQREDLGRVKVVNFLTNSSGHSLEKTSQRVNIFSGMDASALSEWLVLVMKSLEFTHPTLFEQLPSQLRTFTPLMAEVFLHSAEHNNLFLTPSLMETYCNLAHFSQYAPDTAVWKTDLACANYFHSNTQLWTQVLSVWAAALADLHPYADLLDSQKPQCHLIPSIANRDIVVVILPPLVYGSADNPSGLIGNMIGASIEQSKRHLNAKIDLQSVLFVERTGEAMASGIVEQLTKPSNLGVVWHYTSENFYQTTTRSSTYFVMHFIGEINALDPRIQTVVMRSEHKRLNDLREGEGLLISQDPNVPIEKMQSVYHAPTKTHCFIPSPSLLSSEQISQMLHNGADTTELQAQKLYTRMKQLSGSVSLSWVQETTARMMGYAHWHEACQL